MTDDIIHSTQFHIKYKNRAISANLPCGPFKLDRTIVLQETHLRHKNLCSHGDSFFSYRTHVYVLDFNMLVIFNSKNVIQGQKLGLTNVCFLNHADEAPFANTKMECRWNAIKVDRNFFNIGEVWNPVCCHGNKTLHPLKGWHDRASPPGGGR